MTEVMADAGTATVMIVASNLCFGLIVPQWRTAAGDLVSPGQIHEMAGWAQCKWKYIQFLTVGSAYRTAYARDISGKFDSSYCMPASR